MCKLGFDNEKYLELQSKQIRDRISHFGGKLYLEFGGKLFDDYHASRVLPGFEPDSKIKLLLEFKEEAEIIIAISANDIEKNKVRGDLGITYDDEVKRLIDAFRSCGLYVGSVVITQFSGQANSLMFEDRLTRMGIKVYKHYNIPDYPTNVNLIVSEDGYGKNDWIETTHKLVIVTAPGPGSGKMAVCLSQLYHDHKRGINAGYAKFETFPIWNLPLKHPVNLAYEAATADLADVNMIDSYHLEAYGTTAVNYNRDIEIYPVLRTIFERIYGECPYKSPTDMGVNMAGYCIFDDEACCDASKQEIIRRYFRTLVDQRQGKNAENVVQKIELLMNLLKITPDIRKPVSASLEVAERTGAPAVAIELSDGTIITGKTSSLLGASSAALINALKHLAKIDDDMHLLSPDIIEPIQHLKIEHMGNHNPRLHTDEVLIALAVKSNNDPIATKAIDQLNLLKGCEAHSTVILSHVDENVFAKLGVNITYQPVYQTKKLYHK